MLRLFNTLLFISLITSCTTTSPQKKVISDEKIITKTIEQIDENKLNIALLTPLNKQNEHFGSAIIKSAQLAINDAKNSQVNLVIIDSTLLNSDPRLLLQKLEQNNIKAVVGPVFTEETSKLMPLLNNTSMPVLSLSNDSSLINERLLIMGITPDIQTIEVVNYAISKGIQTFEAVLPHNKFGKLIDATLAEILPKKYMVSKNVTWYENEDFDQIIEALLEKLSHISDLSHTAIFLPLGGSNLVKLNEALEKHNLNITLIGTQTWDHPMILKFPKFEQALLIKNNLQTEKFALQFEQLFHTKPQNIDLIAYNSILLLAKMHQANLPINRDSIIENNRDYGKFVDLSFNPKGYAIYNLSIAEISGGNFKIVHNSINNEN